MPLTGPKIYPKVYHNDNALAIRDMVAFMINDHATLTGPGWDIVEAYDGSAGSRQVPSTTSGSGALASFTGTFSWKDDTVATNDWIVLRTNIGGGDPEFQFYLERSSTSNWQYKLIPLDDFVVDSTALVSPPTLPLLSVGAGTSVVTHTMDAGWFSAVADEQMWSFLRADHGGNGIDWGYVGSVDQPHPTDIRPFIIYDNPAEVTVYDAFTGGTFWNRLDPYSQMAVTGSGYWTWLRRGSDPNIANEEIMWLTSTMVLPVCIIFTSTPQHVVGFPRHIYQAHESMGYRGVVGDLEYVTFTSNVGRPGIAMTWDGVTPW